MATELDDETIARAWQKASDAHVDLARVRWRPAPHVLRAFLAALPSSRVGDGDAREAEAAEIYRAGYVDGGRDELDRQLAGGVQDTPAREEWRIVAADGTVRSGAHPTAERLGSPAEWDEDFLGGPHRLQRRTFAATEWVDVPAQREGGSDGD